MATGFEADVAQCYQHHAIENIKDYWGWTGWKRRHWPARIIRPGFRFYAFDQAPDQRRLRLLLEVKRGGEFSYSQLSDFSIWVERLTNRRPDRNEGHWKKLPKGTSAAPCTGVAFVFKVVSHVDIPLRVQFPRIGWLKLNPDQVVSQQHAREYADLWEGGKGRLVRHFQRERNSKLRETAFHYWRQKMGGHIYCLACGFSFGKFYGDIGEHFIEMHHEEMLSTLTKSKLRKPNDLLPLCSNCHRMAHVDSKRPLAVNELKERIAFARLQRSASK